MAKPFAFFTLLILFLVTAFLLFQSYEPGIPVETLKAKYLYTDSEILNVNGLDVHLRKVGKGKPILLLHGVASSLHTWEGWQQELSDQFQTISIDVPGFGITGPFPDGNYTVDAYMQFIDELLDELKIDTCYIAGNSFGGYLTWNYAVRHPERVQKIILLNSVGYPKKLSEENIGFSLSKYRLTDWFTHLFTPRWLLKISIYNVYKRDELVTEATIQRYYDMLVRKGNRKSFSKILRMIAKQKGNSERLQRLTQPTLIMWGDEDEIIPVRNAKKFENDIPNAKLTWYDSGHIPMEENPQSTAKDARKFLTE